MSIRCWWLAGKLPGVLTGMMQTVLLHALIVSILLQARGKSFSI